MGQRWPLYTGPMWLAPLSRLGSISWKLRQCQIQILSPPVVWKKEREVTQSCLTLCDTMDCSLPGYSVHGIFHERVLEWVAISFSRGSSQPWDGTQVSCIVGRHFTIWATREAPPPLPRSQAYLFNLLEPICFTHPTKTHLTSDSHRSGQLGGLRAITALQSSLTQKLPTGMLSDSLCEGHRSCLSDLFLPWSSLPFSSSGWQSLTDASGRFQLADFPTYGTCQSTISINLVLCYGHLVIMSSQSTLKFLYSLHWAFRPDSRNEVGKTGRSKEDLEQGRKWS